MTKKIVFDQQRTSETIILSRIAGELLTEGYAQIAYEFQGPVIRLRTEGFMWDVDDLNELITFLQAAKEQLTQ